MSGDPTDWDNDDSRASAREEELERRVARRTAELARRTAELEQEKRKLKKVLEESHAAAARLLESEARFRQTAELLPTMVCETDPDDNFTYVNRLGMETLGLGSEDMNAGINLLHDFVHEADRDQAWGDILSLLRGAPVASSELRLVARDGAQLLAAVRSAPIYSEDQIVGIRSSISDRSSQVALQAQLFQADRMASVGLLAAGVAHEINNPLTFILFNLEALDQALPRLAGALTRLQLAVGVGRATEIMGDDARAAGAEQLNELVRQSAEALGGARRVQSIVKDLKTFARADEDRMVPVSVNEVVEGAINMAYNEIKYRARLEKELGWLPPLMANDGKLAQVVLNLLVNAAHAIEEGDVERNLIRVRTFLDQEQVCIEVSDTGAGIAPEDQERIFEPFFSTKEAGIGSGLGLSICRNIVASFDGDITVESRVGEGSRFCIGLPLGERQERESGANQEISTEEIVPPGRPRVLVVDDEVLIAKAVSRILSGDYDLELVHSGAEAQELLERDQRFDVILCDLMMPDISGMDLHDWIQTRYPQLAGRMVFVTGGAFTPRAQRFFREVGNACLEKPFSRRLLRRTLREQLTARCAAP